MPVQVSSTSERHCDLMARMKAIVEQSVEIQRDGVTPSAPKGDTAAEVSRCHLSSSRDFL